jgi:hypothetical protein
MAGGCRGLEICAALVYIYTLFLLEGLLLYYLLVAGLSSGLLLEIFYFLFFIYVLYMFYLLSP